MISVMGLCWVFGYVPIFFKEDEQKDDTTTKKNTFLDVINCIFVVLAAFQVILHNFFLLQIKFYLEIYCFGCEAKMV